MPTPLEPPSLENPVEKDAPGVKRSTDYTAWGV